MKISNRFVKFTLSMTVLILLVCVCWKIGFRDAILGEAVENKMDTIPSFITYEVNDGESLTQTFLPEFGYMTQYRVLLLGVGEDKTGSLAMSLCDDKGNVLWNKDFLLADLKAGEWMPISVESFVPQKRVCHLTFQANHTVEPVLFMLCNRAFAAEENQLLYDTAGKEVAGGMLITFDYRETLRKTTKIIYCFLACMAAGVLLLCIHVEKPIAWLKRVCYANGELRNVVYIAGFLGLAVLFYFTHLYRLFDTPYGLHIDEIGMGFDAWTLANFGVDRYLHRYPVYLINFGGGQSAMHAYLVAVLIKIFGYSEKLFRMPALWNAIGMAAAGALLMKKRWQKRTPVLLFLSLFMISPVFIMFTRFGYDCNLMMSMSVIMLYCFVIAVERQQLRYYVLAGLVTGLTLYTYVISYLILPIFLLLLLIYLIWLQKVNWKQVIAVSVPLFFLGMPLFLEQIINIMHLPEMHLGPITIPRMLSYRAKELSISNYWGNLYDTLKCTFWNDMWNYDSLPDFKMMYWFSIPFAVVGILEAAITGYQAIKDKKFHIDTVILCYFLCVFLTGGLLDGGSGLTCYKINSIYIPVLFFVVQGMITLYRQLQSAKWLTGGICVLAVAYTVSFGQFTDYYYGKEYHDAMIPSVFFDFTYQDIISQIQQLGLEDSQRPICVEADRSDRIYFYASKMISPLEQIFDKEIPSYHNYYFTKTEELRVDTEKAYILSANSRDFAMELEKNGMLVHKIGNHYLCY